MKKSFISILIVGLLIFSFTIFEKNFVNRQFLEFNVVACQLYEKVNTQTAVEDDVIAVKENWLAKKHVLHIFIQHNEIKEMELWISETIKLVKDQKWSDALSKIQVIIELSKEIPKGFNLSPENIL